MSMTPSFLLPPPGVVGFVGCAFLLFCNLVENYANMEIKSGYLRYMIHFVIIWFQHSSTGDENNVLQIPPGIPPPPFMVPPAVSSRDGKRIKFNDEETDENELFAKLLYKKLNSITSRKRLEILHVSIMEMVRQAQEEDERERGVGIMNSSTQAPLMN
ncbi:hypothetical protein DICVIV_02891 [Dictyocaulus viviparus]|uniref:Uncharacterized protein n=1 Tax=Dictyocaulus viviparus TaxID=29172 RepID=A0A0D8Y2K0_DICVI|nr:hypothetical protein DICVIV_02891 [Dictyocaulus viviparus]